MSERTILDLALEALRPFSELASSFKHVPAGKPIWISFAPSPWSNDITIDELRRAAAAVEAIEKMKDEDDGKQE